VHLLERGLFGEGEQEIPGIAEGQEAVAACCGGEIAGSDTWQGHDHGEMLGQGWQDAKAAALGAQ
jgi:hypothetical protein